jgi:hypothetical protein
MEAWMDQIVTAYLRTNPALAVGTEENHRDSQNSQADFMREGQQELLEKCRVTSEEHLAFWGD